MNLLSIRFPRAGATRNRLGWRVAWVALLSMPWVPAVSAKLDFPVTSIQETAEIGAEQFPFTFAFENKGDQAVKITAVKTSCGCTTAELDQQVYEPGEKGTITGVFQIGDRHGVQKKTVTVKTNNLGQPEIKLGLEIKVPNVLVIKPGLLVWRTGGSPDPKSVKLLPGHATVNVTGVECESDAFSVDLLPLEGTEQGYELVVAPKQLDDAQRAVIRILAKIEGSDPQTFFAHALALPETIFTTSVKTFQKAKN